MVHIRPSSLVLNLDHLASHENIPSNSSDLAEHINHINDLVKERITLWINQMLSIQLTPESLFNELQDGIILYRILHQIDPNASLNQITEHAQPGSIRARHNITVFLEYIKNELNSDKIRQFEPDHFIENTDHEPLTDCILDLIDYASREKGFPSLSIDANVLIARERYRSQYSALSPPKGKMASIVDVPRPSHRPSSIAIYSKSSRLSSVLENQHRVGGFSENQQTTMISHYLPPLVENEIDAGFEMLQTENVSTSFGPIPERSSSNASVVQDSQLIISMKSSDHFPPREISDILRQFYGTLSTFPEESRLQSMCELVLQNSSDYYAEIAEEEADLKPITALQIVVKHKGEVSDDDFQVLEHDDRPVDLNRSVGNRQLYLAVSHNDNHAPITDIQLQEGDQESMPPYGFHKILRSVSGLPGNINFGTGRTGLYLCYKQGLAAPIIDIQISEQSQPGYRTLPQKLQYNGDVEDQNQMSQGLMIHYRPGLLQIVSRFESYLQHDRRLEDCSRSEVLEIYYSRASALLCLSCYSSNATLVHQCLHYIGLLGTLSTDLIPSKSLNMLLCVLLGLCPSLSLESRNLLNTAIRVSRQIYLHNLHQIDPCTAIHYGQTLISYSHFYPDLLHSLLNHTLKQRVSLHPISPQHQAASVKRWIRDHIIGSVLNNVLYFKPVQSIAAAVKEDLIDENWIKLQSALISEIVSSNTQSQILGLLVLMSTILAEPPDSYVMSNPNDESRPEHARVLDFIIQICDLGQSHLKSSEGAILVLRRVLIPSAIEACITGSYRQSHFQRLLKLYITLFRSYASELKMELGAWFYSVLLDLLERKSTSYLQKWDILEAIELLLNSAQQVIDVFVNFDNGHEPLPIYERLVNILSEICIEQISPSSAPSRTHSNALLNNHQLTLEQQHLKRSAMSLLVNLFEMQSRWLASHLIINNVYQAPLPSSPRSPSRPSRKVALSPLAMPSKSPRNQKSSLLSPASAETPHRRRSSWREQMVSRDAHHQAIQKAISLAANSSLTSAIRYLVLVEHANQRHTVRGIQWRPVAVFLYRAKSLNQAEVGELLGAVSDEAFSAQDYDDLRRAFTELLDFTNRSFESSLRSFVNDSGFWMPEGREGCERLLLAFSESYYRDNPSAFTSKTSALKLAKACYFLHNDDNVQFSDWVQSLNSNTLDEEELREIFSNLKESPLGRGQDRLQNRKLENDTERREILLAKQSENSVHNALAIIRGYCTFKNRFVSGASSVSIVSYMFDRSWVQFLGCLSSPNITSFADNDLILNGLMHGTICALLLSKPSEADSFLNVLAKQAYLCSTNDAMDRQKITLLSGAYMSQEWVTKFRSLPAKQACDWLLDVVQDIRNRMNLNKEKSRIAQIQLTLSSPIDLFSGDRRMIVLQADLIRLHKAGKSATMHRLHVFNDVLLYGKLDAKSSFLKKPRVLNLLTCKAQTYDVPKATLSKFKDTMPESIYGIEIRSSRKNLVFVCSSSDERTRLISTINDTYPGLLHIHHQRMEAIKEGQVPPDKLKSDQSCVYCLRYFTVFNRKHECGRCHLPVCITCLSGKMPGLGPDSKKVKACDACIKLGRRLSLGDIDQDDD